MSTSLSIEEILENLIDFVEISKNFENLWRLGYYYMVKEKYREAVKLFLDLVDHFPQKWEVLHALGIALMKINENRRALTYFTILNEEYKEKCDVEDLISSLEEADSFQSETHRYFLDTPVSAS